MQNMMLQLNVPGKMIQQAQSQSDGRSGKTAKKDNDFRNLLEHSSGKDASKETSAKKADEDSVGRPEPKDKTDSSQAQETQDGSGKKPDSAGKKEETDKDADLQALQFLMMGNANLESIQVISPAQDVLAQLQPKTEGAQTPAVEALTTEPQTEWVLQESIPDQTTAEEAAGTIQDVQADMAPAMGETQRAVQTTRQTGENRSVEASKAGTDKVNAQPQLQQETVRTIEQTGSQKNQGQDKNAGQDAEHFSAQTYAAETVFQQDAFGIQAQQTAEMAPVAHIQAETPQELMNQLLDQLKAKATLGNQEFEIQIHPENLGRLAIKVAYTLEKVSISIVCTNERTMEMLSAGAKNIAQIMEENLGAPTTVVVEQGEDNYLEQYNNQENSRQQQQEEQQERKQASEENHQDFLQQLRLGLI